jgi:glutaminase
MEIPFIEMVIYRNGDYDKEFAIESISKVFTLAKALSENSIIEVERKIGLSGSPFPFNSIIAADQTETGSINPFVNAGAIATTCMVYDKSSSRTHSKSNTNNKYKRTEYIKSILLENMSNYAGRELRIGEKVYHSESETNAHNKSLIYLLKSKNKLSPSITNEDVERCVDAYTYQCSIKVTAKDLAHMASVFANNGVNPRSKIRVLDAKKCEYLCRAMQVGGLYEYSGLWYAKVGECPAKSGVGGGIMIIVPGKYGVGIFSPRLDKYGNSVRGIEFGEKLISHLI